jgi:hypothetical protein
VDDDARRTFWRNIGAETAAAALTLFEARKGYSMRTLMILPLLALGACQVTKDDANKTTTVEYNGEAAENSVDAAANQVGAVAGDIANDVKATADKVGNKVDNIDVDVKVDTNKADDNKAANH